MSPFHNKEHIDTDGGGGGQSPNLEGKLQLPQKYAEVKFLGR